MASLTVSSPVYKDTVRNISLDDTTGSLLDRAKTAIQQSLDNTSSTMWNNLNCGASIGITAANQTTILDARENVGGLVIANLYGVVTTLTVCDDTPGIITLYDSDDTALGVVTTSDNIAAGKVFVGTGSGGEVFLVNTVLTGTPDTGVSSFIVLAAHKGLYLKTSQLAVDGVALDSAGVVYCFVEAKKMAA